MIIAISTIILWLLIFSMAGMSIRGRYCYLNNFHFFFSCVITNNFITVLKVISGPYCECTNYEGCTGSNRLICSGHGKCSCSKCDCDVGWTDRYCECEDSVEKCKNPGTYILSIFVNSHKMES